MNELIRVGDLVIVGEVDAPEASMVAVVTMADGHRFVRYLGKRACQGSFRRPFMVTVPLTPVEMFSVRITFQKGFIVPVVLRGVSSATYADGERRNWQGGNRQAELADWAKKDRRFKG